MNLKDLFDKSENGMLTYEQFMQSAGSAKFVDLTEGNYVSKQKYTDDLSARDTRINTLDETLKSREADLNGLRQQLQNAGEDATKLGEVSQKFAELQKQYEKDTKAYAKQLRDQQYSFAVKNFSNEQDFTSAAARREFERAMISKALQMEGDTIIGATDFLSAYKQDNADSFKIAQQEPQKPAPHFVNPTNPQSNQQKDENPFHFSFAGVRPKPNDD